jgi:hypothetical protein
MAIISPLFRFFVFAQRVLDAVCGAQRVAFENMKAEMRKKRERCWVNREGKEIYR